MSAIPLMFMNVAQGSINSHITVRVVNMLPNVPLTATFNIQTDAFAPLPLFSDAVTDKYGNCTIDFKVPYVVYATYYLTITDGVNIVALPFDVIEEDSQLEIDSIAALEAYTNSKISNTGPVITSGNIVPAGYVVVPIENQFPTKFTLNYPDGAYLIPLGTDFVVKATALVSGIEDNAYTFFVADTTTYVNAVGITGVGTVGLQTSYTVFDIQVDTIIVLSSD